MSYDAELERAAQALWYAATGEAWLDVEPVTRRRWMENVRAAMWPLVIAASEHVEHALARVDLPTLQARLETMLRGEA